MDEIMKLLIFLCLLFAHKIFAAPTSSQIEGGVEHIVIINKHHPAKPRVSDILSEINLHETHPAVRHIYNNSAFHGFAATIHSDHVNRLSQMSQVHLIEPILPIGTSDIVSTPDHLPQHASATTFTTRDSAPWGLQRISTTRSVDGDPDQLEYTYKFGSSSLGDKADVYIIDTGIYTQNQVFGQRAKMLWSFDGNMTAVDGHGTHVSGIAGGDIVGVASNAHLLGLKALSGEGSGSSSNVVKAIDLAIQRHCHRLATEGRNYTGAVMSLSLASSEVVKTLNHAVDAAADAGIHTVVAAGNNGGDPNACSISPASAGGRKKKVISVGAISISSRRAAFSNYGKCVDIYAPGVNVISAWIGAPDRLAVLDGTSMSTPHVTGLIAYSMMNRTLARDPALMKEFIMKQGVWLGSGIRIANNGMRDGRD